MNWSRLLRLYTLIAAVSTVSLFVFSAQFADAELSILVAAVATIALLSAIVGVLLSASDSLFSSTDTGTPASR